MKMNKRIAAMAAALVMLMTALTGCGENSEPSGAAETEETKAAETTTSAVSETQTETTTTAETTAETTTTTTVTTEIATETEPPEEPAEVNEYDDISFLYGYKYTIFFEPGRKSDSSKSSFGNSGSIVVDTGEGYKVTGSLTYYELAPDSVSLLETGDTFYTTAIKKYIITDQEYDDNGRGTFYIRAEDGTDYVIYNLLSSVMDFFTGEMYYVIKQNDHSVMTVLENFTFFVPYGGAMENRLRAMANSGAYETDEKFNIYFDENGSIADYQATDEMWVIY